MIFEYLGQVFQGINDKHYGKFRENLPVLSFYKT